MTILMPVKSLILPARFNRVRERDIPHIIEELPSSDPVVILPSGLVIDGARRIDAALTALRSVPAEAKRDFNVRCVQTADVYPVRIVNHTLVTLNKYLRMHWRSRGRVAEELQLAVFTSVWNSEHKPPPAEGRRRVAIRPDCGTKMKRFPDPDNVRKVLLDVLVKLKLLVDDSYRYCECVDLAPRRSTTSGITLFLSDLPEV